MAASESNSPESEPEIHSPFVEIRYSLPALLREVKRDRASATFAMEKLDQTAINALFEQQQARRESNPRQQ